MPQPAPTGTKTAILQAAALDAIFRNSAEAIVIVDDEATILYITQGT